MDGKENALKPLREPTLPPNGSSSFNGSTTEDPLQEALRDD
jgi:hypothetical protein